MLSLRRGALLALAVVLAALPVRAAEADKALPDDTEMVVTVNVRQFLDSPLIKKAGLDKALAGNEESQKVLKDLGLDPLKDIDRVILAGGKGDDQTLIVIKGNFDPEKIAAKAGELAKEHKDHVKVHKADGTTLYEITGVDKAVPLPPQAQGQVPLDKPMMIAVADKTTVVAGVSKDAVTAAIARVTGKKSGEIKNKELKALLAKQDAKQTVSIAIPGGTIGQEKIKHVTGGITVGADIKIEAHVATTDLDAAKELNDQFKEGLMTVQGLVGGFAAQQKALMPVLDILNGIKHDVKDKDVIVNTTIKGETIEALLKGLASLQGGF